jgi:hypothetical protein
MYCQNSADARNSTAALAMRSLAMVEKWRQLASPSIGMKFRLPMREHPEERANLPARGKGQEAVRFQSTDCGPRDLWPHGFLVNEQGALLIGRAPYLPRRQQRQQRQQRWRLAAATRSSPVRKWVNSLTASLRDAQRLIVAMALPQRGLPLAPRSSGHSLE